MKKLIGFVSFVFFACFSLAAQEYSFHTSSGLDTIFAVAGEDVEETYFLSGENITKLELQFDCGCFLNILDEDTILYPDGDYATVGSHEVSGQTVYYTFDRPWGFRQLLTLKGKMRAPSANPYEVGSGQISFMVRAKIIEADGDTQKVEKMFTIRRIEPQTFDQTMGNGLNRIEYAGQSGYLVYCSEYSHGYFISDSKVRYCVPWTRNGLWSSDEYTGAVVASWGWDMAKAKKVSNGVMYDYPLADNLLLKPGYCAIWNETSYYESKDLGRINSVSKEDAYARYDSGKVVYVPDSFLANYLNSTSLKSVGTASVAKMIFQSQRVVFDPLGRKMSVGLSAMGLKLVRLPNGATAKSMNLNRLTR